MHYISAIIKRILTIIHMIYLKILYGKRISFGGIGVINSSSHIVIQDRGYIRFGKSIGIRRRCEFSTSEIGEIVVGDNVFFNNSCMIVAHNEIKIGDRTRFGPNVMVFDHDYEYKDRNAFLQGKHKSSPIVIGKNCWIGAGTIILRGTVIGDDCVVGAGCIIKGNYPSGSMIVQKRNISVQNNALQQ